MNLNVNEISGGGDYQNFGQRHEEISSRSNNLGYRRELPGIGSSRRIKRTLPHSLNRDIQPATLQEVKGQIDGGYNFAVHAEISDYRRGRDSEILFVPGKDYAELPGFGGRPPKEIVASLQEGSRILDVGCGYGQIGAEILGKVKAMPEDHPDFDYEIHRTKEIPAINSRVEVYGFDAQAQKGQDRLHRMVIGNIDDLSLETFGESFEGFDLVISSSLLYHLPDYWGGILRMTNVLKPKGILLASTLPRVIYPGAIYSIERAENEKGYLNKPDDGNIAYYGGGNVSDIHGRIIPPGQVVDILNAQNVTFRLEYRVASSTQVASIWFGGQISGERRSSEGNLDLSSMYYSLSGGKLGYILAQSDQEKSQLEAAGYMSVPSRLSHREQRPSLSKTDNTAPDGIVPTLYFQQTAPEIGRIYGPDKEFKIIGYQAKYEAAQCIDSVPQRFVSHVIDTGFRVLNNESRMIGEAEGSLLDIAQSHERIFFIEDTRNWTKPTPKDPKPVYPYEPHLIEEMVCALLQTQTIDAWVSMIPGLIIKERPSLSEDAKKMYQRLIDSADKRGIVVSTNSRGQFVVQRKGEKSLLAYTE